jgi:hypothetical protein
MGAPVGNQNAVKGKLWQAAINRALEKRGGGDKIKALDDLAEKLLAQCDLAELQALKELGDRLDGKPTQATEISGPDGADIPMRTVVNFVAPSGG